MVPVDSSSDPTAGVVMLGPPSSVTSPCGTGELGRELSSTSVVACESELDAWAAFIRAFDVVEYSG